MKLLKRNRMTAFYAMNVIIPKQQPKQEKSTHSPSKTISLKKTTNNESNLILN